MFIRHETLQKSKSRLSIQMLTCTICHDIIEDDLSPTYAIIRVLGFKTVNTVNILQLSGSVFLLVLLIIEDDFSIVA